MIIACTSTKHSLPLYQEIFLPSYMRHCSDIPHLLSVPTFEPEGTGCHGSQEWLEGTWNKLRLAIELAHKHKSAGAIVCVADVDILWLSSPIQAGMDLLFSHRVWVTQDNLENDAINSGIIAFQPSDYVIECLGEALSYACQNHVEDQVALKEAGIPLGRLPLSYSNTKTVSATEHGDKVCFHPTVSQPSGGLSSHDKKRMHIQEYIKFQNKILAGD